MEFYSASRIRICPANGSRPAVRCVGRRIGLIPGIGKTPFDTTAFSKRRRRLLATGIAPCRMERNASSLTTGQLRKRAWPVTEPRYRARLRIPADAFEEGWRSALGSKALGTVAPAATESAVEFLLVEAARKVPRRLAPSTGAIPLNPLQDPHVEDLLSGSGSR